MDPLLELPRVLARIVFGDQGDVVLALAQRRHGDREHVQAKQEVAAEASLPHRLVEVRLVAATTRASIFSVSVPPTRSNSPSWSTRRSAT